MKYTPNFLLIGDLKAGSSSLHCYLQQHPEIYMPKSLKELRYFSYDKNNPYHKAAKSSRVRTFEEYLRFFENCGDAKAIGETSPNYLRSPLTAEKIASKLPGVRLIACLRNPADRLFSVYMMAVRSRSTTLNFDEWVFSHNAARIKSNYFWADLKKYFDTFETSQLKIILFDNLKSNAADVVVELYRFLDVKDTFMPNFSIRNQGGVPKNPAVYSLLVRTKQTLHGLGKPPVFAQNIWANIKRNTLQQQSIGRESRQKVLEICRDDILRTQELIDRDLSMWMQ